MACKQNIHCEIMLVKHALQPYEQILKQPVNGTLNNIRRFRSREFYDMFKSQIIAGNETMRISNFLASYCAADKKVQGFCCKSSSGKREKTQRV